MSRGGRIVIRVVTALVVLGLAALATGGWMMWKRPLTVDAYFSRAALRQAGLEERTVRGPNGAVTYFSGGAGTPTLVLLHGAGDQAGAWGRVVGPLAERYRLVVPDLPGHWGSDPDEGPISVPMLLGGVRAVLDAEAEEPATVVGNSLGAWLAMLVARERPGEVSRIVAVNGGAITEPDPRVDVFPADRDAARRTMAGLTGPDTPEIPGFVLDHVVRHARAGPAARFAETADEMGEWVLDGRLGEVTTPVDLVWGEADELMDLDYAARLMDGLPAARLTLVERCGHIPQRECPAALLDALTGVLSQPPPAPGPAAPAGGGEGAP